MKIQTNVSYAIKTEGSTDLLDSVETDINRKIPSNCCSLNSHQLVRYLPTGSNRKAH